MNAERQREFMKLVDQLEHAVAYAEDPVTEAARIKQQIKFMLGNENLRWRQERLAIRVLRRRVFEALSEADACNALVEVFEEFERKLESAGPKGCSGGAA